MSRQIFLDTETTGLSPETGDRVIELGCIEMVNRRLTGQTRHYYFNPERPSSEEALKVHGLTDAFLADKPKFAEVADEWLAWMRGAEVIIHNASFDVNFLNHELKRAGKAPFAQWVTGIQDSLTLAREMFPGKRNSLDALCARLEVDNSNRTLHGALLDAGLLAEVFIRMTRGQDSLVMDAGAADAERKGEAMHGVAGLAHPTEGGGRLQSLRLRVVQPTDEELAAHARVLAEINKSSGGKTLWPQAV